MTRKVTCVVLLLLTSAAWGCRSESPEQGDGPLEFQDAREKASYGVGYRFASGIDQSAVTVSPEHILAGVRDGIANDPPRLDDEEIDDALAELEEDMLERGRELAEENARRSDRFLADNLEREEVRTLAGGVQYEVLREGDGPTPDPDDTVLVRYEGRLLNDRIIHHRDDDGETVDLAATVLVPGLVEAITRMREGSRWMVYVPPARGYDQFGQPNIPPNSTLIFDVELLSAQQPGT